MWGLEAMRGWQSRWYTQELELSALDVSWASDSNGAYLSAQGTAVNNALAVNRFTRKWWESGVLKNDIRSTGLTWMGTPSLNLRMVKAGNSYQVLP